MSFGFSVGDFVAVYQLANKIRKEFVDAPSQFKDISDEVRNLSIVLLDVEVVLPQQELTSQQTAELHNIAEGCRNVLTKLNGILKKYQELDSNHKTFGKKAWKRLKWEPDDIRELRSRVVANVTLLNAFQGRLSSQISLATKDSVDRLHKRQDNRENREEHQAILDWLTPIDYAPQQSDFISRRQEGTGQWLLNSNKFQEWFKNKNRTLFCPGMPGAGKTILTSIVVEHLWTEFQNDASIGIAYLYCNFRQQDKQKPTDLLLSLLKQLVQEQPFMPESIKRLHEHHNRQRTWPSLNEISKVLHSVVAGYSRTFLIIDALDECQVSDGGHRRFLSEIFNLQGQTLANLFVTSRFIPEIAREFEERTSLEIRASDEDVGRYIDGHIPELPSFVRSNPKLQEEIKTAIIKVVDGMFLLAQLHLHSLIGKRSPKAVSTALQQLSSGSEAYDHAYNEAMVRIKGQVVDSQELAKQVLSWIICAKRPLITSELQHALAVEIGTSELDEKNLTEIEDMISVYAGLVTVDETSNIIRLVHYTTQEYFERTWTSWFPDAERDIATACVTYLFFDVFQTGFCSTDKEFTARLQLNPLYDYAARNWGYHAHIVTTEMEKSILDLLENEAKVSASSQAMTASGSYLGYSQRVPRQMTGVHLAAYFGLKEAMMALLKKGHHLDCKDTYGQTPLSWAAGNGQEAVVKLLLEKGAELEPKSISGRTPLRWAAENAHEAVVKLLLEKGAELESRDNYGQTPLSWAAENGHEAVVKLLLEKGAELEFRGNYNQTPLSRAAEYGHEAMVKLLLEKGAELESRDNYGRTPLLWAAENGHEAVVKLLLEEGATMEFRDNFGQTPLSRAVENGREAVMKLLLEKGAELESRDNYGQTPLSRAAENGRKTVVKLLLEKGAELESRDKYDQTPLSRAAKNGHEAVVKLLLEKGAELESRNNYGQTSLSRAAQNGHETVAKLLLERGAELESRDNYDQTPLLWAAENGHEAVVKLLLEKGAELESRDNYGKTSLRWAAENEHETVVKLLLEKGAELDSKSIHCQTPLSRAAENGHKTMAKLLLEKGAELESRDDYGRTPLLWAAENGHEAVVKVLLEEGAEMEIRDSFGQTPLSRAVENGREAVVKLLLEKGAELESRDNYGQTPLSRAAENERETMVKLLLEKGAKLESRDKYGWTSLSRAARNGHKAVVKLLLEKGADLESRDKYGWTPLMWAAENGHETTVKLLQSRA